jgi:VWFA-related protein
MVMARAARQWSAMLAGLCLLASISCSAQAAEEKQATTPTLKIEVRRVLVPVVVRDRQGHAVDDLQQRDFEILDEGKPGTISSFMMERLGGIAPASGSNGGSQAAQTAPAGSQDAVVYPAHITVFLFDDLHLSFEDLVRVRAATVAALPGTLTGTDMAAVVSISGNVNTGLTRDRNKLEDALRKLAPHALYRTDTADCPLIDYYEADLIENKHDPVAIEDANRKFANCNLAVDAARDLGGEANLPTAEHMVDAAARRVLTMGLQDVQTTYAAISTLVNRLAPLPGERTLILVSPGFLNVEREAMEMESRIIDLAARQNIVVSALDSRGLYTTAFTASEKGPPVSGAGLAVNSDYRARGMKMAENPMEELADGTGGTFFHNNNDLNAGLKRMTEEPECVYLIELSLDGVKPNGSYHRLKVKVDREGVQLEARRGYFIAKPGKEQR